MKYRRGEVFAFFVFLGLVALNAAVGNPAPTPAPPQAPSGYGPPFYVLDGYGGVHGGGSNPPPITGLPYSIDDWYRDLEIKVVECNEYGVPTKVGVWVLDGMGGVHVSQGAPLLYGSTPFFGFDIAKDLEVVFPVTKCQESGY